MASSSPGRSSHGPRVRIGSRGVVRRWPKGGRATGRGDQAVTNLGWCLAGTRSPVDRGGPIASRCAFQIKVPRTCFLCESTLLAAMILPIWPVISATRKSLSPTRPELRRDNEECQLALTCSCARRESTIRETHCSRTKKHSRRNRPNRNCPRRFSLVEGESYSWAPKSRQQIGLGPHTHWRSGREGRFERN